MDKEFIAWLVGLMCYSVVMMLIGAVIVRILEQGAST